MSPRKMSTTNAGRRSEQRAEKGAGPAGRTRRRGATLEHALLDAAWEELQTSGYAKLTMERVAERAGTSRAVIYRRWPNRAALAIAALRHRQPVLSGTIPDTGTLRGDVLAILRRASVRLTEPSPDIFIGLLGDLLADEGSFDTTLEQITRSGGELMKTLLARAADRGEARIDVSPRVARLPLDLLRHELIITHQPPSQRSLEEIVDEVFLPLVLKQP